MKDYIPKSKFDFQAVELLTSLNFEEVKADVPQLLEWLQDINWPVAHKIAEYLAPHVNEIKDELLYILNTDDAMWEYWIICSLIARSPVKPDAELILIIKRIAEYPTKNEKNDEVDEVAKEKIIDNNW